MARVQLDGRLLVSLLFLVSCLVVAIRSFFRPGRDDGGARAAMPSPPGLPVIGNLHQLGRGRYHRALHALARRHGPIFQLRLGSVRAVVVSSASLAEAVLKTQDHVFCGRPQQHTARGTLYDCRDVAFSPYGERWRQLRRIAVVHLLSAKRVDSFRALREEEVASFVDRIRVAAGREEVDSVGGKRRGVNLSELLISLTNTVVSRAAFGTKLGGLEPWKVHEMLRELTELLETIAVSDMFPRLRWVDWATGLDARIERTARKLDDILEMALREHEKSGGNDGEAQDLMDDLLSVVKKGGDFQLERTDVKALILDLFIAGTDTVYKTIEWTMAELVKNPREMKKVQAEVRNVAGARGAALEEQLEKMTLLQAAMKEAMRLHPPVPLLVPHEAIQDTKLHGYHIHAKTRVMVNVWAIGRDSESWEEAEEFRPERFVHDAIDYSGKDFRFIPFGSGRRGCPGIAFGTRLAELTLANMMYHFDWELPDGKDIELFEIVESSGLSPGLECPLTLAVKPLQA